MTKDYEVTPGLYAVGMDAACEIYDGTSHFIPPATAVGFAINSGRMAAESALEYIKSVGEKSKGRDSITKADCTIPEVARRRLTVIERKWPKGVDSL